MRHRFVAPAADRLDRAIAAATPLSRNRARAVVEAGGAFVDGVRARFPSMVVPEGAVVELRTATAPSRAVALPEVHRDPDLLVIDKPCGLPSQAGREGGSVHVYGILSAREAYVGLHHRLDTPASGLLLVTLRPAANGPISAAFREGRVHRAYLAVVLGDPGPAGAWTGDLDGETAATDWVRLSSGQGASVLLCTLRTGRTHQVRRHAADAGHPILGDRRHGGAAGRAWPRLALHAWRLRVPQPATGQTIEVVAPVPADLAPLVARSGYDGLLPPARPAPDPGDDRAG